VWSQKRKYAIILSIAICILMNIIYFFYLNKIVIEKREFSDTGRNAYIDIYIEEKRHKS
jgi:hypothetical protein